MSMYSAEPENNAYNGNNASTVVANADVIEDEINNLPIPVVPNIPELVVGQRYKVHPISSADPNAYIFVGTFSERTARIPTHNSPSPVTLKFTQCILPGVEGTATYHVDYPHLFTYVPQPAAAGGRRRSQRRKTRGRRHRSSRKGSRRH